MAVVLVIISIIIGTIVISKIIISVNNVAFKYRR